MSASDGREEILPHSIHRENVTVAGLACVKAVCSCGMESSPTNRPQHLGRWERGHRNAHRMRKI